MKLAAKRAPTEEELKEADDEGFNHVELYLTSNMLDNRSVENIVSVCEDATVNIANVHTPHISLTGENQKQYFKITNEIADKLDACLIIDSNPTSTSYTPTILPPEQITAPNFGHENDPSVSKYYLRMHHLHDDIPLVIDTAHLHMSEEEYMDFFEEALQICSLEELPSIHLADGTRLKDGVPFEEGTVPLERVVNMLDVYNYEGTVVLETPQGTQQDALHLVQEWLNS